MVRNGRGNPGELEGARDYLTLSIRGLRQGVFEFLRGVWIGDSDAEEIRCFLQTSAPTLYVPSWAK